MRRGGYQNGYQFILRALAFNGLSHPNTGLEERGTVTAGAGLVYRSVALRTVRFAANGE
jgi:hypothetical protein